jgi:alpha-beta hydrolase superfamily lysophospholipase
MFNSLQRQFTYFDNQSVRNRIIHYTQEQPKERLIFVPNWRAEERHWMKFVKVMSERYRITYFESREKSFTDYQSDQLDLTVDSMATDLVNFLNQIDEPYHLVGTSIGASTIIKAWDRIQTSPRSLTLMCPIMTVRMPAYFKLLPLMTENRIKRTIPVLRFLMNNSKKLRSVGKNLKQAFDEENVEEILVMKTSVQHIMNMKLRLSEVKDIDCPSLVFYTKKDRLHSHKEANAVATAIPQAKTVAFDSFRAVHKEESAHTILSWLDQLAMAS